MNGKKTNVKGVPRRFYNRFQKNLNNHRKTKIPITPIIPKPTFKFPPYTLIPKAIGALIFSLMTGQFLSVRMPFFLKAVLPPNVTWRENIAEPLTYLIVIILFLFSIWFSWAFERSKQYQIKFNIKLAILIGVTFAVNVLFTLILGNAPLYAFYYSIWTMLFLYIFGENIRQLLLEKKFFKQLLFK